MKRNVKYQILFTNFVIRVLENREKSKSLGQWSFSPAASLPHLLAGDPPLLPCASRRTNAPSRQPLSGPRRGLLRGWSGPRGMRRAARRLLKELAEGGDVDLSHLERLGLGQLLVALQVRDDAPQTVEGDVEAEHPSPLPGVGCEAATPLRPLQGALVRVQVMQRAAGGAQSELHDGARSVRVVAFIPLPGPLKQSVDVGMQRARGRWAGARALAGASLQVSRDERR